ncbi:uncharacterized protein B0H64DRAFT_94449 [Chaetomium fimeti]|uniref:Uncharacterized protein n=1 Tax=Chaetomium fimeti TaxID=1854472 RepID=A0AAE0HMC9_9PEZI|nr:hypothetical protein B0H64DRAFT_94449 [Chaetomium fimeti]
MSRNTLHWTLIDELPTCDECHSPNGTVTRRRCMGIQPPGLAWVGQPSPNLHPQHPPSHDEISSGMSRHSVTSLALDRSTLPLWRHNHRLKLDRAPKNLRRLFGGGTFGACFVGIESSSATPQETASTPCQLDRDNVLVGAGALAPVQARLPPCRPNRTRPFTSKGESSGEPGWTMTCSGQGHLWFAIGLRKKQRYLSESLAQLGSTS